MEKGKWESVIVMGVMGLGFAVICVGALAFHSLALIIVGLGVVSVGVGIATLAFGWPPG